MHSKKMLKKLDKLDMVLLKLSLVFIIFFLLLAIPSLMNWLHTQKTITMLIVALVLAARPIYKTHKKK